MSTGGSSSGAGTAAGFWAASVGTDTGGSILVPAHFSMLVAIRPTVGRISQHGVIPISSDRDTAGPMARSVADAALLLGAMEEDEASRTTPGLTACRAQPGHDYTRFLRRGGLAGARIGIPRAFFMEAVTVPGESQPRGGLPPVQQALMDAVIQTLKAEGAVVVDPADPPSVVSRDAAANVLRWPSCTGLEHPPGKDEHCSTVLRYGMKRDFNAWLASLGTAAPVRTLTELREWNLAHVNDEAIRFGQDQLDASDSVDLQRDRRRYERDRTRDLELSRERGIDAAIRTDRLDALLFPGFSGAYLATKAGYPAVMVPVGMVPNVPTPPLPESFGAKPVPFGVMFVGPACGEPRLIELAYSLEQATLRRVPPPLD